MQAVLVEWQDATSVDTWEPIATAVLERAHRVRTLGWLVSENKARLVVALNYDPSSGAVSQYLIIPRSWCLKITRLKNEALAKNR